MRVYISKNGVNIPWKDDSGNALEENGDDRD